MRRAALLGAVLLCVALTGCDDVLVAAKLDPIQDDRLVGTWVDADDPDDAGVIEKSGDGYTMRSDKPDAEKTRFTLARAADVEFVPLEEKCSGHVFSFPGDPRTCYRIVRIEFGTDFLTFAEIDIKKFQNASHPNLRYRIATDFANSNILQTEITNPRQIDELQVLLDSYTL